MTGETEGLHLHAFADPGKRSACDVLPHRSKAEAAEQQQQNATAAQQSDSGAAEQPAEQPAAAATAAPEPLSPSEMEEL